MVKTVPAGQGPAASTTGSGNKLGWVIVSLEMVAGGPGRNPAPAAFEIAAAWMRL
jgi:hypothetical protein